MKLNLYRATERFKGFLEEKNKSGTIVYKPDKEYLAMYPGKQQKSLFHCKTTGVTMKEVLRYMDFLKNQGFHVNGKYSTEGVFMGFTARFTPDPNFNEKSIRFREDFSFER